MAYKPCDICHDNTSAKKFYTGHRTISYGEINKDVKVRVCKRCYKAYHLSSQGFIQGYFGKKY
jgi:hypothetical protein